VKSARKRVPRIKLRVLIGPGLLVLATVLVVTWFSLVRGLAPDAVGEEVSFSRVEDLAARGRIVHATLLDEDSTVQIVTSSDESLFARYPKSDSATAQLIGELTDSGAEVVVDPQSGKATRRFLAQFLLPLLILASLFSFFFLLITGNAGGAGELLQFSKMLAKVTRRKKGKGPVTFADAAAVDEAVIELREVVEYLMNPLRFASVGAKAPKGVLLAGPPGTGKTLLARATAGEANVPFFSMAGSEFVEALVGIGAARVRDLFKTARANAPCLVFIDELDAAGRQRGAGLGQGNDEREQTLNQMLAEMDGFDVSSGVVIMAATNRPDILDPALLRPGRFDRQVVVEVPDVKGRVEILNVHTRNRPLAEDADLLLIAKQTPGFTGAELANVVNEAALLAVRRDSETISTRDLDEAVERTIAGPQRKAHILTEQEKVLVANHEAGHAIVARAVSQAVGVQKLSIVARGRQLGHATNYQSADKLVLLKSDVEAELTVLLAGLAAENIVFGEISTGSKGDLEKATDLARKMVATWGMTHEVGRVTVQKEGAMYLGRDAAQMLSVSQTVLEAVDKEVRDFIEDAEHRAETILRRNRDVVNEIVQALIEREALSQAEVEPFLTRVEPFVIAPSMNGSRPAAAKSSPRSRTAKTS